MPRDGRKTPDTGRRAIRRIEGMTMSVSSIRVGALPLALALTAACGAIPGNGVIRDEERLTASSGEFDAVDVSGAIHAEITLGEQASARLIGDENLIHLIQLE